jgi:hypothetical protein
MDYKLMIVSGLVGGVIGTILTLIAAVFIPQPRDFVFGIPGRFRKQSLRSMERDMAWLKKVNGNSFELLLYIATQLATTLRMAIVAFLLSVLVALTIILFHHKRFEDNGPYILLWAFGPTFAMFEKGIIDLFQRLKELRTYDQTVAKLHTWIDRYSADEQTKNP